MKDIPPEFGLAPRLSRHPDPDRMAVSLIRQAGVVTLQHQCSNQFRVPNKYCSVLITGCAPGSKSASAIYDCLVL